MSLHVTHHDFQQPPLEESQLLADPIAQFLRWVDDAVVAGVLQWEAMTLAIVSAEGRPSARIVYLRGVDSRGFVFYTNYDSRKGRQLAAKPHAALVLHWKEIERQVCIEGDVTRTSAEESDAYFAGRPLDSQLGAWASLQSEPLASAETLEQRVAQFRERFRAGPVPRPPHWGGFRLTPNRIEFWQGRPSRLHDRFVYLLQDDGSWTRQRLNP